MDFQLIILIFVVTITPLSLGKPLCDSLEEYFRKSKQPGARRLKKTVTRICTAFDVVKYDGVDPIDLILPPAEDDDDIGTDDRRKEKDFDDDFSRDYDLSPQEEIITAAAASRFRFPNRWSMSPVRYRDWRFSPRSRARWQVSDRRHHREKSASKTQNVDDKVEKTNSQNDSADVGISIHSEEIISTTSRPIKVANETVVHPEDIDYIDDEDYLDEDENNDPVLTDLADFVASVRFLSLNDTTHLNVIFPPNKNIATDKIDSGKPALAIEAPEELLPSKYRIVFPLSQKESSLPDVYRIYTEFSCNDQPYKPGVYADIMTECQAFHLCLPAGHGFSSATFLCPRNLRYNQRLLRCDWSAAVNCSDSSRHFISNKHFRHNYTAYLQSLHTLLHGDDIYNAAESAEMNVGSKDESVEVTTRREGNLASGLNIALLGKLRSIISSE